MSMPAPTTQSNAFQPNMNTHYHQIGHYDHIDRNTNFQLLGSTRGAPQKPSNLNNSWTILESDSTTSLSAPMLSADEYSQKITEVNSALDRLCKDCYYGKETLQVIRDTLQSLSNTKSDLLKQLEATKRQLVDLEHHVIDLGRQETELLQWLGPKSSDSERLRWERDQLTQLRDQIWRAGKEPAVAVHEAMPTAYKSLEQISIVNRRPSSSDKSSSRVGLRGVLGCVFRRLFHKEDEVPEATPLPITAAPQRQSPVKPGWEGPAQLDAHLEVTKDQLHNEERFDRADMDLFPRPWQLVTEYEHEIAELPTSDSSTDRKRPVHRFEVPDIPRSKGTLRRMFQRMKPSKDYQTSLKPPSSRQSKTSATSSTVTEKVPRSLFGTTRRKAVRNDDDKFVVPPLATDFFNNKSSAPCPARHSSPSKDTSTRSLPSVLRPARHRRALPNPAPAETHEASAPPNSSAFATSTSQTLQGGTPPFNATTTSAIATTADVAPLRYRPSPPQPQQHPTLSAIKSQLLLETTQTPYTYTSLASQYTNLPHPSQPYKPQQQQSPPPPPAPSAHPPPTQPCKCGDSSLPFQRRGALGEGRTCWHCWNVQNWGLEEERRRGAGLAGEVGRKLGIDGWISKACWVGECGSGEGRRWQGWG